jgi:hypothetical protein
VRQVTMQLHDPVVSTVLSVFEELYDELFDLVVDVRTQLRGTKKLSLERTLEALSAVIDNIRDRALEVGGLAYILANFEQVQNTFADADAVIELMDNDLKFELSSPPVTRLELQTNMQWVTALVATLTPAHLTLQEHVMKLGYAEFGTGLKLDSIDELFIPLLALRNEYFRVPRRDLLVEYIALAEAIASSKEYEVYIQYFPRIEPNSRAVRRAELAELATQLEVLALLETLTSPKAEESS